MSEGFDYQAWQRQQSGVDEDAALLVTFFYKAEEREDGEIRDVEWIKIWKDRYTEIERKVTDEDRARFETRYQSFLKNEEVPDDGTPIGACSLAMPSNIAACKAMNIKTLEQLAETPDSRLSRSGLLEFKYTIKEWLQARKRDWDIKEVTERLAKLEAENAMLKEKFREAGLATPAVTKKRGRPKGSKNAKPANGS